MAYLRFGDIHIISVWQTLNNESSLKYSRVKSQGVKRFNRNRFLKFIDKASITKGKVNGDKTFREVITEAVNRDIPNIKRYFYSHLEALKSRQINTQKLKEISIPDDLTDNYVVRSKSNFDYIFDRKYKLVSIRYHLPLNAWKRKYLKQKRYDEFENTLISFEGLEGTRPSKNIEEIVSPLLNKGEFPFLFYSGMFDLVEPIQLTREFVVSFHSLMEIGNELFSLRNIEPNTLIDIVEEKNIEFFLSRAKNVYGSTGYWGKMIGNKDSQSKYLRRLCKEKKLKARRGESDDYDIDLFDLINYFIHNPKRGGQDKLLLLLTDVFDEDADDLKKLFES